MSEQEPKKKIIPLHTDGTPYSEEELEKLAQDTGMPRTVFIPESESHKIENVENPQDVNDLAKELTEKNELIRLIAEKEFERKKATLGCDNAEIDTPEKLEAWSEGKNVNRKAPSGTIPLTPRQAYGLEPSQETQDLIDFEGSCMDLSYDSQQQMIQVLKAREKNGDEQAKVVLQKLYEKTNQIGRAHV